MAVGIDGARFVTLLLLDPGDAASEPATNEFDPHRRHRDSHLPRDDLGRRTPGRRRRGVLRRVNQEPGRAPRRRRASAGEFVPPVVAGHGPGCASSRDCNLPGSSRIRAGRSARLTGRHSR